MKKANKGTFYCLMSEFYDDGICKAAIFTRDCNVKPENSFKDTPIADCYKDWYDTMAGAEAALAQIKALGTEIKESPMTEAIIAKLRAMGARVSV